jgi:hypothetical protein
MALTWDRYNKLTTLALHRAERCCEGAVESTKNNAEIAIMKCFGDLDVLHEEGLTSAFMKLARKVIGSQNADDGWQLIAGLCEIRSSKLVHKYRTNSGTIINLTRESIVNTLLDEYVNKVNLMREFQETSAYATYKDVEI